MPDSIEIIGGVIAIIMAMYAWIKKPIEDMKSEIMVGKMHDKHHKEEIIRLRDNHHQIRGTLQVHEGRISQLESKA